MPGALIQLVAYGVQDLYLTGNPQITFFKIVYRRHTNFSIESVKQPLSLTGNFGEKTSCTLGRIGDLAGMTYVHVKLPAVAKFCDEFKQFAWVRNIGHALIKEITLEIGGKMMDRQYGEFFYIWSQLAEQSPDGLDKMIGNLPELYEFSNGKLAYDLYIPLQFWFNRVSGLYLPLVALYSCDVKIGITFRCLEECCRIDTNSIEIAEDIIGINRGDYIEQVINNIPIYGYCNGFDYLTKKLYYIKIAEHASESKFICHENKKHKNKIYKCLDKKYYATPISQECYEDTRLDPLCFIDSFLYVDYVYLDVEERRKFQRANHEYLITQLQHNYTLGIHNLNAKQILNLSHPCKEHFFVGQLNSLVGPRTINDLFNYTDSPIRYPNGNLYGKGLIKEAVLILSGEKLFPCRQSVYFNKILPYEYHYRGPPEGINCFPFCLRPEDLIQPSGSCNMSMFEDITMNLRVSQVVNKCNKCSIRSYTNNFNIFRVFFGLGGLAFVS